MPLAAMLRSLTDNLETGRSVVAHIGYEALSSTTKARLLASVSEDRLHIHWTPVGRARLASMPAPIRAYDHVSPAMVVIPLAPFIVPWIFGTAYHETTGITQVLFLVTSALFVGHTALIVANALRLDRLAISIVAGGVIANIVLNAMTIPQWGPIGAAWTTVATESLIAVGLLLVIERRLRERTGAQADATMSPEWLP